jgi:cytochrome b561
MTQLRNTNDSYGIIAQSLHWLVAAFVFVQLGLGLYAAGLPVSLARLQWLSRHKSLGLAILALVLLRLAWRSMNRAPALPDSMPRWQRGAATTTHWLLYALLVLAPLAGWMHASAAGLSVNWFGLFQVPDLIPKQPELSELLKAVHRLRGAARIAASGSCRWRPSPCLCASRRHHASHAAMAATEETMMLRAVVLIAVSASLPVWAEECYTVDGSRGSVSYEVKQAGSPFRGKFLRFGGEVCLSAERATRVEVWLEPASVDSGLPEIDVALKDKDFFAVNQYPRVVYTSQSVEARGNGQLAHGMLQMKGNAVTSTFRSTCSATAAASSFPAP